MFVRFCLFIPFAATLFWAAPARVSAGTEGTVLLAQYYNPPSAEAPAYSPPSYNPPTYSPPTYSPPPPPQPPQPVWNTPTYTSPAYTSPTYYHGG